MALGLGLISFAILIPVLERRKISRNFSLSSGIIGAFAAVTGFIRYKTLLALTPGILKEYIADPSQMATSETARISQHLHILTTLVILELITLIFSATIAYYFRNRNSQWARNGLMIVICLLPLCILDCISWYRTLAYTHFLSSLFQVS